ncbi:MAG: 2-C-methyl-D-erythritol 4-phosphate cytidylyltransferase [Candidatus Eremiobacteraeota bacterium]|nr:2-C-methyl-D-erythritol 4-phosphate cytidylyltransferase [Candidatus Eremiobacteraeota bacterium]MBV8204728.1 2-C-methyl-D-erythritol 4-phosphate cytidylyltransferase [Candidatus Eremiobacteraeota bacterium]MBV8339641.1 2-C-methyl-D-erythritol 4-phosphate cytidylyltransferase [Candidatus Eremiobacteraeota bacterium]MBV8670558.1 2-C-methyl-D-erythritol 4-phosphate cytidylyltransferase [Candidatus Eremiobacteraeota bacterium]
MGQPKQLLSLAGRPIAAWSLAALAHAPSVNSIVIACEPEQRLAFQELAVTHGCDKVTYVVGGGATRQESVFAALRAMSTPSEIVVIHDGARPFARSGLVEAVIKSAQRTGGAIAAIAVKDTIKQVDDAQVVDKTIARNRLWAAQTPQAFAYDVLYSAHERAQDDGFLGTDDAELVERLGSASVAIVEGASDNLKITTPEDLVVAECLATRQDARL